MISGYFFRGEGAWSPRSFVLSGERTIFAALALLLSPPKGLQRLRWFATGFAGGRGSGIGNGQTFFANPLIWRSFLKKMRQDRRAMYSMKNLNDQPQASSSAVSLCIFLVRAYQHTLSPEHGIAGYVFPSYRACRFFPTCSAYAIAALRQYGLFAGLMVSLKRILRCHPWHVGGYDPL